MTNLRLLDTKEIAEEMQKPRSTIQRWARQGLIPSVRAGWRTRLYDPEAVKQALMRLAENVR